MRITKKNCQQAYQNANSWITQNQKNYMLHNSNTHTHISTHDERSNGLCHINIWIERKYICCLSLMANKIPLINIAFCCRNVSIPKVYFPFSTMSINLEFETGHTTRIPRTERERDKMGFEMKHLQHIKVDVLWSRGEISQSILICNNKLFCEMIIRQVGCFNHIIFQLAVEILKYNAWVSV